MCGLTGIILLPCERPEAQWNEMREIFTRLLVANESRGRFSTGVASMDISGAVQLYKDIVPASELIKRSRYRRILKSLNSKTSILMGHTRHPTVGSISVRNAQPILVNKSLLGVHNGTVKNYKQLIAKCSLKTKTQVDSEVLLLLAEKAYSPTAWNQNLSEILSEVQGTFACVIVSRKQPGKIIILQREKPLSIVVVPDYNVLVFSSEYAHIRIVFAEPGFAVLKTDCFVTYTWPSDSMEIRGINHG